MSRQEDRLLELLKKEPLSFKWCVFRMHLPKNRVYKLLSQLQASDKVRSRTDDEGIRRYYVID